MLTKTMATCLLLSTASLSFAGAIQTKLLDCKATNKHGNMQCTYLSTGSNRQGKVSMHLYAQTTMPYALCSKALCRIDHKKRNMSICTCPVYGHAWQGASVGPKSYKDSKPTMQKGHLKTVTSNFSMANLKKMGTKPITCKANYKQPWANCFGVRCQVTYVHKGKKLVPQARCVCPVSRSKALISVGPGSTKQCNEGAYRGKIWSAALPSQGQSNGVIIPEMYKKYFNK